jgi:Phosphoribosylanthranilate isomerase
MARVKICGITQETDLSAAVEAGADAIGLISGVGVDTHREVDPATAADLAAAAPPFVTTTLVTTPSDPSEAVDIARTVAPDAIQLHSEFDGDELGYVRAETEAKLLLAVGHDNHDRARALDGAVDAVLVDSTSEDGGGGTGQTHDWEATGHLARELTSPVVLAGGLTPENVAKAVQIAEPFGVDVASGVELDSGKKDHNAVARFVANAGRGVQLTP